MAQVKRQQSEWVGTKEALQITGIKSGDTLKRLRELPDSPITSRLEGIMPKYCRASLVAYCESKILKPSRPGRNLAALYPDLLTRTEPMSSNSSLPTPRKRKADRTNQ